MSALLFQQINEFVKLGGDQLVPYYADILGAILPCISDKEEKIRVVGLSFSSLSFYNLLFKFSILSHILVLPGMYNSVQVHQRMWNNLFLAYL